MRRPLRPVLLALLGLALLVGAAWSQWDDGGRRGGRRRGYEREWDPTGRGGVPTWENEPRYADDVFTFVRVRYQDRWGRGYRGKWKTDYPDSDLNFSFRLQQLTSLRVNPDGLILELTDQRLFDYPFIYLIEPGLMELTQPEVEALRRYLLGGGFLMVDDFWGEDEWYNFYRQIKRVFPDRDLVDLDISHEIFHCVYDLKELPLVPSIHAFLSGMRTERWDAQEPHYRALFDDNNRMMAIICHNTDLGDGWEREGVDPAYFHEYSEKWSYPLGINIVVYALTH